MGTCEFKYEIKSKAPTSKWEFWRMTEGSIMPGCKLMLQIYIKWWCEGNCDGDVDACEDQDSGWTNKAFYPVVSFYDLETIKDHKEFFEDMEKCIKDNPGGGLKCLGDTLDDPKHEKTKNAWGTEKSDMIEGIWNEALKSIKAEIEKIGKETKCICPKIAENNQNSRPDSIGLRVEAELDKKHKKRISGGVN